MVSLKPSNASQSVGMEGPILIESLRFESFDYEKDGTVIATGIGMMLRGTTPSGDDRAQFYSVGDPESWEPENDGVGIVNRIDSSRTPKDSCHFMRFLTELDNAGFNVEEEVDDDISVVDGAIVDFQAVALSSVGGNERPKPMPAKLLAAPGEKNEWRDKFSSAGSSSSSSSKGSRRSAAASSKRSAAASASAGSRRKAQRKSTGDGSTDKTNGIDEAAHKYMLKVLEDYEEIPRDELADLILNAASKDAQRKEIIARVYEEDFLSAHSNDWKYSKEVIYALEEAGEE